MRFSIISLLLVIHISLEAQQPMELALPFQSEIISQQTTDDYSPSVFATEVSVNGFIGPPTGGRITDGAI